MECANEPTQYRLLMPFKICKYLQTLGTLSAGEEPLCYMSLRFRESPLEQGYVGSCSASLNSSMCIVMASYVPFGTFNFVARLRDDHGVYSLQITQLVIIACTILWSIGVALLALVRRHIACVSNAAFERLASMTIVVFVLSVVALDKYNLSQLFGIDPKLVLKKDFLRDSLVLLSLDAVVTISCIAIPIRWYRLWLLNVFTALIYPLVRIVLRSAESDVALNAAMLSFLIAISSMGKYRAESKERSAFLTIITERRLRCEAEHQLEKQIDSAQKDSSMAPVTSGMDGSNSAPSTTNTGRIFRKPVSFNLPAIITLGIKERWLINAESLQIHARRFLGSGGFGQVSIGSYLGAPVAVKVPRDSKRGLQTAKLSDFMNELRVLRQVRHPNLVGFYGACISSDVGEIALVIEFVPGRSLDKYLFGIERSPDTLTSCTVLFDICCALRYLHHNSPRIVHADLKCSNVLLEFGFALPGRSAVRAKVCDFGLSTIVTRNASNAGGTVTYQAPELLVNPGSAPSTAADLFSFGRVAFAVAIGKKPLAGLSSGNIRGIAKLGRVPELAWPQDNCSLLQECRSLCERCLQFESTLRPSIEWAQSEILAWRQVLLQSQTSNWLREASGAATRLRSDGESKVGSVVVASLLGKGSTDVWACINVLEEGWPIVCCSDKFQMFGCIEEDTPISKFIVESDFPGFYLWVQQGVNSHLNDVDLDSVGCSLSVRLHSELEQNIEITALCLAWEIDVTDNDSGCWMCIVFDQLTHRYLKECTSSTRLGGDGDKIHL